MKPHSFLFQGPLSERTLKVVSYLIREHILLIGSDKRSSSGDNNDRQQQPSGSSAEEDKQPSTISSACQKAFEELPAASEMFAANFISSTCEIYFGQETFNGI